MKIATIIGARPQFIKAAPVSEKIMNDSDLSEFIIHTGQHYSDNMSNTFFKQLNIPNPSYNLNVNQKDYAQMIDEMINKIVPVLKREGADGVIVYGDTNSTLAGSISATCLNIPLFHVEAGLRSYNRAMLEEKNRIISDHLSALLFCPSLNSVNNLKKENIRDGVILSGDVMFDSFLKFSLKSSKKNKKHNYSKYVLATIHRRENIYSHENLSLIFRNLDKINKYQMVIMPLHPHSKSKIDEFNIQTKITIIEPVDYFSMLSLINDSEMVITDSGGLQKESYFAKKKCMVIRSETEWIELIENKANLLCDPPNIYDRFKYFTKKQPKFLSEIFGAGNASSLIIDSIVKYFS